MTTGGRGLWLRLETRCGCAKEFPLDASSPPAQYLLPLAPLEGAPPLPPGKPGPLRLFKFVGERVVDFGPSIAGADIVKRVQLYREVG